MSAPASGGRLDGMHISMHHLPEADPAGTGWVDAALSTVYDAGDPLGALVGLPPDGGDPLMIVGWPDPAAGRFELVEALPGRGTGPARCLQLVAFDGPRTPAWVAAEQLAATRLRPATQDIAGIVWTLRLRAADGAVSIVTLAETAEAIAAATRAVMSTALLPGEDPALLTGPDRVGVHRLLHADLPIEAAASAQPQRSRS